MINTQSKIFGNALAVSTQRMAEENGMVRFLRQPLGVEWTPDNIEDLYADRENFKWLPNNLELIDGDEESLDPPVDLATFKATILAEYQKTMYTRFRQAEYPPIEEYIDGIVKGDQAQVDAYIAACQAVKTKYSKEMTHPGDENVKDDGSATV